MSGRVTASAGERARPDRTARRPRDQGCGRAHRRSSSHRTRPCVVHRYYDPATGQFLSRDPLVAVTGSAYGYVDGTPLNGTDPSGLSALGEIGGVLDAVTHPVRTAHRLAKAISCGVGNFAWGDCPDTAADKVINSAEPIADAGLGGLYAASLCPAGALEGGAAAEGAGVIDSAPAGSTLAEIQQDLGALPRGNSPGVWTVGSENELQQLFDQWTEGGSPTTWKGYEGGQVMELTDGTRVGIRPYSGTGGSTIDISRAGGGRPWRVHIR